MGEVLILQGSAYITVVNVGKGWLFIGNDGCALFFVDLLVVQGIEFGF